MHVWWHGVYCDVPTAAFTQIKPAKINLSLNGRFRKVGEPGWLGLVGRALGQDQLHPAHVVPAAELLGTAVESTHQAISHMGMEVLTVVR